MTVNEVPLSDVWQLRQEVMYPHDSIDVVKLDNDEAGIHLGLYEEGQLITVISLFLSEQKLQFRKFATRKNFQGNGFGTFLLQYVIEWAKANHYKIVWCNARVSAVDFYKQFDLKPFGETWEKNGIEYIKMQMELNHHGNNTCY